MDSQQALTIKGELDRLVFLASIARRFDLNLANDIENSIDRLRIILNLR